MERGDESNEEYLDDNGPSMGEYEEEYWAAHYMPGPDIRIWRTKDGTIIPIASMDTGHILNCIALLERQAPAMLNRAQRGMVLGPKPSGDGATDAFDSAFDELLEADPIEFLESEVLQYRWLIDELETRGVEHE